MIFITNRTPADAALVETLANKGRAGTWTAAERTQYLQYLLGAYSFQDVNRVSENEADIADMFSDFVADIADYRTAAISAVLASLIFPSSYYDLDDPILPTALGQVDYTVPTIQTVKTDWNEFDKFTDSDLGYYLANISTLKNVLPITTRDVPSGLNGLDTGKANDIEQILLDVYNALIAYEAQKENAIDSAEAAAIEKYRLQGASWWLSGEIYCGEV